jgi:hypothetical protein
VKEDWGIVLEALFIAALIGIAVLAGLVRLAS